jgi:hypothetical protein
MFVGFSKLKLRVSYVLLPLILVAMTVSYFYSAWAASKRFENALPRDGSDSIIKGLLTYQTQAGRFPKTFTEVEERVWKHKTKPNFGEAGRTLSFKNYHYIYYNKDAFTCTLWALPAGERRSEASSFFFYITTTSIRKWKGPDLNDDDIKKLSPTPDSALLGVLGMTEQPVISIKQDKQQQSQISNGNPLIPGLK